MKLAIFSLAFSIFLLSCTSVSTRPKDDLPNMVKGRVVSSENTPVAGAEVTIKNIVIDNALIEKRESFSVTTDSLGQFEFASLNNTKYSIYASQNIYSKILSRISLTSDSLFVDDIKLGKKINLKGRVFSEENTPISVFIPSDSSYTTTDENGFYILDNVPSGSYDIAFVLGNNVNFLPISVEPNIDTVYIMDVVIAENEGERAVPSHFFEVNNMTSFSVSPIIYDENQVPNWYLNKDFSFVNYYMPQSNHTYERESEFSSLKTVLIEDFNNFTGWAAYTKHTSFSTSTAGKWYFFNDENDGGNSYAIEDISIDNISNAVDDIDNNRSAVSLNFVLDEQFEFPHVGIGFRFLEENKFIDLSGLEKVEFWAKGNFKRIRFEFVSNFVAEYPEENNWGHLGNSFIPGDTWQKYEFESSSFAAPQGSIQRTEGVLWSDISDEIESFNFITENMPGDSISFSVTDIFFHGVDITTFYE